MAVSVSTSSTRIVDACMRYAASVEYRGVKLEDLCTASGVCERRVRQAFVERYAMPPTARLQFEALLEARRRLLDPPPSVDAVTRVALDLGFGEHGTVTEHDRRRAHDSARSRNCRPDPLDRDRVLERSQWRDAEERPVRRRVVLDERDQLGLVDRDEAPALGLDPQQTAAVHHAHDHVLGAVDGEVVTGA
jgi:AraC-like DNA-binding protein